MNISICDSNYNIEYDYSNTNTIVILIGSLQVHVDISHLVLLLIMMVGNLQIIFAFKAIPLNFKTVNG